jgi:uncharacterized protein GlcG (DUF336 family)
LTDPDLAIEHKTEITTSPAIGFKRNALIIGGLHDDEDIRVTELTLQQANRIIEEVLLAARQRDMPPLAVAVLDTGAHLKTLQREDGVSFLRVQVAQAKAWGALAMACNTDQLAERYNQDAQQQGFIDALNAMTGGKIIPLPGGVLVRDDQDQVVAAVGAAGGVSQDDEACVQAAIAAAGFSL